MDIPEGFGVLASNMQHKNSHTPEQCCSHVTSLPNTLLLARKKLILIDKLRDPDMENGDLSCEKANKDAFNY